MYFLVMLELPLVHPAASWKLSLSFFLGSHSSSLFCLFFLFFFLFLHVAVNESLTTKETSRSGKAHGCLAQRQSTDAKDCAVGSGEVFNRFTPAGWPAGGGVTHLKKGVKNTRRGSLRHVCVQQAPRLTSTPWSDSVHGG